MNRPIFTNMSSKAIVGIVENIQATTERNHGKVKGCLLQADYAAIAMFIFMDMATAHQNPAEKQTAIDDLMCNLTRMTKRLAAKGIDGLMGGSGPM